MNDYRDPNLWEFDVSREERRSPGESPAYPSPAHPQPEPQPNVPRPDPRQPREGGTGTFDVPPPTTTTRS